MNEFFKNIPDFLNNFPLNRTEVINNKLKITFYPVATLTAKIEGCNLAQIFLWKPINGCITNLIWFKGTSPIYSTIPFICLWT